MLCATAAGWWRSIFPCAQVIVVRGATWWRKPLFLVAILLRVPGVSTFGVLGQGNDPTGQFAPCGCRFKRADWGENH
jgi:hypothetical protein